jgi:hypothetical protein
MVGEMKNRDYLRNNVKVDVKWMLSGCQVDVKDPMRKGF